MRNYLRKLDSTSEQGTHEATVKVTKVSKTAAKESVMVAEVYKKVAMVLKMANAI